jgi:hypothetical protein
MAGQGSGVRRVPRWVKVFIVVAVVVVVLVTVALLGGHRPGRHGGGH